LGRADLPENVRRKAQGKKPAVISPLALEAVRRIDALFDIERTINGQSDLVPTLSRPVAGRGIEDHRNRRALAPAIASGSEPAWQATFPSKAALLTDAYIDTMMLSGPCTLRNWPVARCSMRRTKTLRPKYG
jgi:hypothetical protein